jgi:hypothetical protein
MDHVPFPPPFCYSQGGGGGAVYLPPSHYVILHSCITYKQRPLGRPRHRWIDNFKMDLLEIGLSVVDWIGLAQDRYRWRALVKDIMNFRVP